MARARLQTAPAPVETLNELTVRGYKRADSLEQRFVAVLEPILRDAGERAARAFLASATDHLTADASPTDPVGAGVPPPPAGAPTPWTSPAPDELLNVSSLVSALKAKTEPVRLAVVEQQMTPALKAAGLSFDITNPLTAKLFAQTGSQITNIAQTTQLNVMKIVRQSYQAGLSIPDTAKAIQAGMASASKSRATLIARTELAGAVNGGSLAATQIVSDEIGTALYKQWLTAPGAAHPRHEDYDGLDGQTVRLDDTFEVGEDNLQFPGDPDGSPDEVCNCRCTLVYTDDASELTDGGSGGGVDSTSAGDATSAGDEGVGPPVTTPDEFTPPPGDDISVPGSKPVPPEYIATIKRLGLDKPISEARPVTEFGQKLFPPDKLSTEAKYFDQKTQTWSADREQLHNDILARMFDGKVAPAEGKEAFLTAGGGASGKGSMRFVHDGEELSTKELAKRSDTVLIDPDQLKAMLPEYQQLQDHGDFYAASAVHEESSWLAKAATAEAQKRGLNIVLDTTGSSASFIKKITSLYDDGYDVKIGMASAPTNDAIARSISRAEKKGGDSEGRYVNIDALKAAHQGASEQMQVWTQMPQVSTWRVYDTTNPDAELVASGNSGLVVIKNPDAYQAIVDKANEGKLTATPAEFTPPPPTISPSLVPTESEPLVIGDASSYYPGAPADAVDSVKAWQALQMPRWLSSTASMGLDRAGWERAADQTVRDAVAGKDIQIRVRDNVLTHILDDGRFKSQFETGTSGGSLDHDMRARAEERMFGYPHDLDPALRPIYGYVEGTEEHGLVEAYGNVTVKLKASVRNRTTASFCDSLGSGGREMLPQPITDMNHTASLGNPLKGAEDAAKAGRAVLPSDLDVSYTEAQIHGGLAVDDIAEVVFPYIPPDSNSANFWRNKIAKAQEEIKRVSLMAGDHTATLGMHEELLAQYEDNLRAESPGAYDDLKARLDALGIPWSVKPPR